MDDTWRLQYEEALTAFDARDWTAAFALMLEFAREGDPAAQTMIGTIFHLGLDRPVDLEQAVDWYSEASASGYSAASNNLGSIQLLRGDSVGARKWYDKARHQGFPRSPTSLDHLK